MFMYVSSYSLNPPSKLARPRREVPSTQKMANVYTNPRNNSSRSDTMCAFNGVWKFSHLSTTNDTLYINYTKIDSKQYRRHLLCLSDVVISYSSLSSSYQALGLTTFKIECRTFKALKLFSEIAQLELYEQKGTVERSRVVSAQKSNFENEFSSMHVSTFKAFGLFLIALRFDCGSRYHTTGTVTHSYRDHGFHFAHFEQRTRRRAVYAFWESWLP